MLSLDHYTFEEVGKSKPSHSDLSNCPLKPFALWQSKEDFET